jgi:Pin2-interacting protein X1
MLSAQGWKPGDTLGAENASHASHYTTASSSHIRVLLREDNLGLGAKNGKQDSDRFGLDMFQGLLGRLNGKSEDALEKEAGYRRDLRLKEMVVKRFGATTFVSGGYLVGDKIERAIPAASDTSSVAAVNVTEKKSKKRKRIEAADEETGVEESKKQKISEVHEKNNTKKEKRKSKKDKRQTTDVVPNIIAEQEREEKQNPSSRIHSLKPDQQLTEKELKTQRKAERKAVKEAKRRDKSERKRRSRETELIDEATTASSTPLATSESEVCSDAPTSGMLQRTSAVARGRFAVRSRYSQQKRLAVADSQALKEIFMIKAEA